MLALVVVVLVITTVLVVLIWRQTAAVPASTFAPDAPPASSNPPAISAECTNFTAQLLFASARNGVVSLDAILLQGADIGGHRVAGGTPLMLRLSASSKHPLGSTLPEMLASWAAESRVVDVRIGPPERVRIESNGSTVQLRLEQAIGLRS